MGPLVLIEARAKRFGRLTFKNRGQLGSRYLYNLNFRSFVHINIRERFDNLFSFFSSEVSHFLPPKIGEAIQDSKSTFLSCEHVDVVLGCPAGT